MKVNYDRALELGAYDSLFMSSLSSFHSSPHSDHITNDLSSIYIYTGYIACTESRFKPTRLTDRLEIVLDSVLCLDNVDIFETNFMTDTVQSQYDSVCGKGVNFVPLVSNDVYFAF